MPKIREEETRETKNDPDEEDTYTCYVHKNVYNVENKAVKIIIILSIYTYIVYSEKYKERLCGSADRVVCCCFNDHRSEYT